MKNQALFSLKDKSKKIKCLQFLFGTLRVKTDHRKNIKPMINVAFVIYPQFNIVFLYNNRYLFKLYLLVELRLSNTKSLYYIQLERDFFVLQPATVSRCGMIYLEPSTLGWRPIVKSWIQQFGPTMEREGAEIIDAMFEWLVDPSIDFVRKNCKVRWSRYWKILSLT